MAATDPIIIPLIIDGKQITPTLTELTKELKAARREQDGFVVGSQQYEAAGARVRLLAERHREVSEATADSRNEGNKLLDVIRGFGPGGQIIGQVADTAKSLKGNFGEATGSLKNFSGGFGVLKTAIASTGIGLLILAITSLVAWMKNTDSGAKFLEGSMNALGNIFKVLTGYVISFGKILLDVFIDPVKTIERFNSVISNPIETFKNLISGASKFKDEMVDATKAGFDLADAMDAIDEKQRSVNEQNAFAEKQISKLIISSKDRTKSEEERLRMLDLASQLETTSLKRTTDLQKQKLAAIDLEIAQAAKIAGRNEVSDDLLNKRSALIVEGINLEKQSLDLQEKVSNRRNGLLEAERTEREKSAKQKADQAAKDAQLEEQEWAKAEALRGKAAEYDKFVADEKLKQQVAAKNARLELISTEEEEQKLAIEQQFFGQIEAKKQQEEALYQVEKAAKERRLKEITGDGLKERADRAKLQSDILKGESERAGREIELEQRTNKLKDTLRQTNLAMTSSALQLGIQFLSRDEESRKKYGVAIKGLAIADIAVNLSKELSSIAAAAAANPANALTFGAAGATQGAILSGIAIGRAALQTATVLGTQYSLGGISKGSRHGSAYGVAGIAMIDRVSGLEVGEMEGNEAILTSGVVNNPTLLQAASRINVLGGGRAFAADGAVLGGAPTSLDLADPSSNALIQEFRTMSAKIDTWQRELKVTNNITSLYKKQAEYEKMVETTNI